MNRRPYTGAHTAAVLHDHRSGHHATFTNPACTLCARSTDYKYVVFDSDGNEIETIRPSSDLACHIGLAVLRQYALVDSEPGADEPFLTIARQLNID